MRRSELRAEINVTPLVDVCLVLLIIFMVVTPVLVRSVDLPDAPSPIPRLLAGPPSRITLAYGPPMEVSVDDDPAALSPPALEALLRALHAQAPRREILFRADRRIPYGEVRRVLQAIREAGFPDVALIAEKTRTRR